MSTSQKIWSVLAVALLVVGVISCGVITSAQSAQQQLLSRKNAHGEALGNFDAAKVTIGAKIETLASLVNATFAAETNVQVQIAEKRAAFGAAVNSGDPGKIVDSAAAFGIQIRAVAEATPNTGFADMAKGAMREFAEAFNQLNTALTDINAASRQYNQYRQSLFMPLIVGNLFGYPEEYAFYTSSVELPNPNELFTVPPTAQP